MSIFDYNPTSITPYPYWRWNKVLPAVYDDSLSQYEILSKLLYTVNQIIESTNSTGEQVEQLTQLVQQLIDGSFPSGIVAYVTEIANAAVEDDIEAITAIIDNIQEEIDSFSESTTSRLNSVENSMETINDISDTDSTSFSSKTSCCIDMMKCITSYLDNVDDLIYNGNNDTIGPVSYYRSDSDSDVWHPYTFVPPIDGRKPIDCISFVQLVLMGVPYSKSRYVNTANERFYKYGTNFTSNGKAASYYFTREHTTDSQNVANGRYWVQMFAKMLHDNGQLIEIDSVNDLNPCDVVFFTLRYLHR